MIMLFNNSKTLATNYFHVVFYAFLSRDDDNPAESINSDLQRGLTGQTYTTHTTLNTEQKQLAIKVSADN